MLVLSLRTLLAQPLLWVRLKNMVTRQRFDWLSMDESRPLPVSIPSMPLSLKIIWWANANRWPISRNGAGAGCAGDL